MKESIKAFTARSALLLGLKRRPKRARVQFKAAECFKEPGAVTALRMMIFSVILANLLCLNLACLLCTLLLLPCLVSTGRQALQQLRQDEISSLPSPGTSISLKALDTALIGISALKTGHDLKTTELLMALNQIEPSPCLGDEEELVFDLENRSVLLDDDAGELDALEKSGAGKECLAALGLGVQGFADRGLGARGFSCKGGAGDGSSEGLGCGCRDIACGGNGEGICGSESSGSDKGAGAGENAGRSNEKPGWSAESSQALGRRENSPCRGSCEPTRMNKARDRVDPRALKEEQAPARAEAGMSGSCLQEFFEISSQMSLALYPARALPLFLKEPLNEDEQTSLKRVMALEKIKRSPDLKVLDALDAGDLTEEGSSLRGLYESNQALRAKYAYLGTAFPWLSVMTKEYMKLSTLDPRLDPGLKGSALLNFLGRGLEENLCIRCSDLTEHAVIFGSSGSGKTKLLTLLIVQAVKRGDCVIVIDPKADPELMHTVSTAAAMCGRDRDFALFDPSDLKGSSGYNPVGHYQNYNDIAERLTAAMPSEGSSASFKNHCFSAVSAACALLELEGRSFDIGKIAAKTSSLSALKEGLFEILARMVLKIEDEQKRKEALVYAGKILPSLKKKAAAASDESDQAAAGSGEPGSAARARGFEEGGPQVAAQGNAGAPGSAGTQENAAQADAAGAGAAQENEAQDALKEAKPKRGRRSTSTAKTAAKKPATRAAAPKVPSMSTIAAMYRYLTDKGYVKNLQAVHELISICGTTDDYYNKVTSGLKPLFSILQSGSYGELLCPGRDRPCYTMADVISGNAVFYAALRALNNSKAASDLGKMMLADLRSMAGRVADQNSSVLKSKLEELTGVKLGKDKPRPLISIFIDEASEVVCESMVQLLNKARSSNMAVTLATQTKADFAARTQNEHTLGQVTGNCNTIISLRLSDDQSGRLVSSILGNALIATESRTLSFTENPHNDEVNYGGSKTITAGEAPLVTPSMLSKLPPGEFFARLPNASVVKGKIPMVTAGDERQPGLKRLMIGKETKQGGAR